MTPMAMIQQPFLPFMHEFQPPRGRRRKRQSARQRRLEVERQALRSKTIRRMMGIVEGVAEARSVTWQDLFSKKRGNNATARARVLAMGLCCALDLPQYMVARAFQRTWATVFCAEQRCSKLYKKDPEFRKEWDRLFDSLKTTP